MRAEFHDPQPPALPIRTERLTLRRTDPRDDAAAMARAWADPEFARYLLLPARRTTPRCAFATLQRSKPPADEPHRMLGLVMEHDGEAVGDVVLMLEGAGLTRREIGWTMHPWAAGRGFATEAARAAARARPSSTTAYAAWWPTSTPPTSAPPRSAERLGMRRETHRLADFWSKGRWTDSSSTRSSARSGAGSPDRPRPLQPCTPESRSR